mgnify:CR=1 FL=1
MKVLFKLLWILLIAGILEACNALWGTERNVY